MVKAFDDSLRGIVNANIGRQDSTFKLKYFKLHGLAYCSRLILAATGAQFELIFPTDWAASEKHETVFGVLPVLYETTASGEQLSIPEAEAIEQYLAKKFNLLGDQGDVWDEIKVRAFASSQQGLINYYFLRVATVKDETYKKVMHERFLNEPLPHYLTTQETHLEANGRNGHFVGNKLTLADLKCAFAVEMLMALTGDQYVSEEQTPGLWTVYKTVNAIPSLVAWKATEEYKSLAEGNLRMVGF